MKLEDIQTLDDAENYIFSIRHHQDIEAAHIAVTLAKIRRDRLFIEVSSTWKAYILQERTGIRYKESIRLADIGEKYLTFRDQLEENGIKLSENMSKMNLFDPEIAAKDPVFFKKFKTLSYRKLRQYIKDYKNAGYTVYPNNENVVSVTERGASLFIDGEKVQGVNLNEFKRLSGQGKRAVVVWVDSENEARRVKRRLGLTK